MGVNELLQDKVALSGIFWSVAEAVLGLYLLRRRSRIYARQSRRLNEVREEEARRIAFALHSEASQLLASTHIALGGLALDLAPVHRDRLRKVKDLLDNVESQVRKLSHELHPPLIETFGLIPALESLARSTSERSSAQVSVEGDAGGRLPPLVEITVYRIVQEALANALRHGYASRIWVTLQSEAGTLRCSVRDNGVGSDRLRDLPANGDGGLGLLSIRERLDALGGTFLVNSRPGQGTELVARIPIQRNQGEKRNPPRLSEDSHGHTNSACG